MKSYLDILLPDGTRVYEPNDLFRWEISRVFISLVEGTRVSLTVSMAGDFLFRGSHVYDVARGRFPRVVMDGSADSPTAIPSLIWNEAFRYRGRVTRTISNPGYPAQKSFVLSRLYSISQGGLVPFGNFSSIDVNLRQQGTVYSHSRAVPPLHERAWFDVPADVAFAAGTGTVSNGGSFLPGPSEEGHYIYDVRIKDSVNAAGNTGISTYVWRRRPYVFGNTETGSARSDYYNPANGMSARVATGNNSSNLDIGDLGLGSGTDTPSEVPYGLNYPTLAARSSSRNYSLGAVVFDGLVGGRLWWTVIDNVSLNSTGRSLWTWKRMSPEAFRRADADMTVAEPAIVSSWPVLGSTVQYRDLKAGRGGFLYLACDGSNDVGTGTPADGSLIQINVNTLAVIGNFKAVTTGLATSSVLAVAVDKSELFAGAGKDRVWILTRSGLAFTDVTLSTGATSAWTTAISGAPLAVGSQRGLGGLLFGSAASLNLHKGLLDVDRAGNVYWISAPPPAPGGIHRVNKLDGTATTHSFVSLADAVEPGAAGFLQLGLPGGGTVKYMCSSLIVHRRDAGDPYSDDLWLGAGDQDLATVPPGGTPNQHTVQQIPLVDPNTTPLSGTNPGFAFYRSEFRVSSSAVGLSVSPDGSVWAPCFSGGFDSVALLESIGRKNLEGVGVSLTTLGGGSYTLVSTGTPFLATDVEKVMHITDTAVAGNTGRYKVTGFTSTSTVTVKATTAVPNTTELASPFHWSIDRFDSDAGTDAAPTQGTWLGSFMTLCGYNVFPDGEDSGIAFIASAMSASNVVATHILNSQCPVSYQYSGAVWYRSRFSAISTTRGKVTHGTSDTLGSGVKVSFADTGAGPIFFKTEEYYTWVATMGLMKDSTQEVTWSFDMFSEKTDLILDEILPSAVKTAVDLPLAPNALSVGVLDSTLLTDAPTKNPFLIEGVGNNTASDTITGGPSSWILTIGTPPFAGLLPFAAGGFLTISEAFSFVNNGTFPITAVTASTVTFTNASGVADGSFEGKYAASLAKSVTNDPTKQNELAHHERRFHHDGAVANNTTSLAWTAETVSTTDGVTYGLQFGSGQDVASLRFGLKTPLGTTGWANVQIQLYSSTDAAGPSAWTLRDTYKATEDHPFWNIATNAFHDLFQSTTIADTTTTLAIEIEIDVASLLGGVELPAISSVGGNSISVGPTQTLTVAAAPFNTSMVGRFVTIVGPPGPFGTNHGTFEITAATTTTLTYTNVGGVAQTHAAEAWTYSVGGLAPTRYWKIFIGQVSGSVTASCFFDSAVAYDSLGFPIDVPSDTYLTEATASNYLANMVLRATWEQDSGVLTAASGPGSNQATLTADTFEVALSGAGTGVVGDFIAVGPPSLNLVAAPFDTSVVGTLVGRYVTILGASAGNNGTFLITGNPSNTTIEYTNPYAVAQASLPGTVTYSIDGVAALDFLRVFYKPTVGLSITAPVQEIQTLTVTIGTFVPEDLGRVIVVTSTGAVLNAGVFLITRYISATQVQYRNAGGDPVLDTSTITATVYREYQISASPGSITTTVLTFTADVQAFAAQSWEVVRNADVRPRDNEGGGENVARIPDAASEIFVCPVTGHIWYAPIDVLRGRQLHVDKYVKVKRSL